MVTYPYTIISEKRFVCTKKTQDYNYFCDSPLLSLVWRKCLILRAFSLSLYSAIRLKQEPEECELTELIIRSKGYVWIHPIRSKDKKSRGSRSSVRPVIISSISRIVANETIEGKPDALKGACPVWGEELGNLRHIHFDARRPPSTP